MGVSGAGARIPVIVGVGEISHRSKDPARALEPLALMQRALAAAEADAGVAGLLGRVDSIDVVCEYAWPYDDAPGRLAARLGARPGWRHYGDPGGESPVRLLHEAALRIARGESEIALVTGAEARYSVEAAAKAGIDLTQPRADAPDFVPWTPRDTTRVLQRGPQLCHPTVTRHGMAAPITLYPLYENATAAAWGQTPRQARAESAQIWADFAAAAAAQPAAWSKRLPGRDEIEASGDDNRPICWPYTRHLVANPLVNMGAGLLLTHEDQARALGIAPSRWIYPWGGAAASEPRDILARDHYRHAPAQEQVLADALALAGGDPRRFAALELYSCFPVVPKMARRTLGLPAEARLSTLGGLSFFGAPLHDTMSHGAVALVRALRARPGRAANDDALALLYGQGEYVTKHHALVLGRRAPAPGTLSADYRLDAAADARRGVVPPRVEAHAGAAALETFTVVHRRDGSAEFGCVLARTPDGARLMARVAGDDAATIAALTDLDAAPDALIGRVGTVIPGGAEAEALLHWTLKR